ncbi:Cytosolic iron-sulfur protein assembly protein [Tilletia horrida]|nr:Cytosolic iron-sulfur protein assembly protein [Tilletia horrida]KAK0566131.1 Cytosolic iron-sulfur protein assembly protein [Tilletia horrida]
MSGAAPEVKRLRLLADLPPHESAAWDVSWNPTLPVLASCSTDKHVRLFRYATSTSASSSSPAPKFRLEHSLNTGHRRTVRQVAWAPNGRLFATASFDSTIGIWEHLARQPHEHDHDGHNHDHDHDEPEEPEWDCVGTLEGHDSECKSVAFSPTGHLLASCSRDKSVWIWECIQPPPPASLPEWKQAMHEGDAPEFECLSVQMSHSQDVKRVLFHPDPARELLVSASYDDSIKFFRDDPSDDWYCARTLSDAHKGTVWSLAFSPDGRFLASCSDDMTIHLWRDVGPLAPEQRAAAASKPPATEESAGTSGDEKWVLVGKITGFHSRTIYTLSWAPDPADQPARERSLGRLASAGGDGRINVFELTEPETPWDPAQPVSSPSALCPSHTLIASLASAHGVADINAVAFAPTQHPASPPRQAAAQSGQAQASRFEEIDEEAEKGRLAMGHLLASCADDGSVRVWVLPSSPWYEAEGKEIGREGEVLER